MATVTSRRAAASAPGEHPDRLRRAHLPVIALPQYPHLQSGCMHAPPGSWMSWLLLAILRRGYGGEDCSKLMMPACRHDPLDKYVSCDENMPKNCECFR